MEQKTIREWNNVQYSAEEGAEIFKEFDDRTKSGQTGYNSIDELATKVQLTEAALNILPKKYGYEWIKGSANVDLINLEVGDELKRVGTLFPGYWVHLYIKSLPIDTGNPLANVAIISQTSTT